jgi:hypothetical protein
MQIGKTTDSKALRGDAVAGKTLSILEITGFYMFCLRSQGPKAPGASVRLAPALILLRQRMAQYILVATFTGLQTALESV